MGVARDIFGLLPYMDSYRRSFTSDRGSNILNALKCELFKILLLCSIKICII